MNEQNYVQRNIKTTALEMDQSVEGILLAINDGKNSKIYSIQTLSGQIEAIYGSAMIDKNLFPTDVGKQVYLEYIGKEDIGDGHTFKHYKIGVKDGQQDISTQDPKTESKPNNTPF